ncbi:hypothetical protein PspLS_00332 [Pyricularia sp. CBS 133598]|nr:hypothetical protein PspLS_00332 [Pyricularia sp. CBS 133598]
MDATAWPAPSKPLMTFLDFIEYSSQMTRADIVAGRIPLTQQDIDNIIVVNGNRRPIEAPSPIAPTDGLPGISPQQPGASPSYGDGESQQPRYGGGPDHDGGTIPEANPSSNQVVLSENVPPTESAAPAAIDAPNNTPVDGPPLVLFSSTTTMLPNRQAGAAAAAAGDDDALLKPGVVVLPATTPVVETAATTTSAPASPAK